MYQFREESSSFFFSEFSPSINFCAVSSSLESCSVLFVRYTRCCGSGSSSSSVSWCSLLMVGNRVFLPAWAWDLHRASNHLKSPSGPVMALMVGILRMEEDSSGRWLAFLLKPLLEKQKQQSWKTRGLYDSMLFLIVGSQWFVHHSLTLAQCSGFLKSKYSVSGSPVGSSCSEDRK